MKNNTIFMKALSLMVMFLLSACSEGMFGSLDKLREEAGGGGSKLTPDPINFTDASATIVRTYGDSEYTNAINGDHQGEGLVSYSSSNTSVATVSEYTGEITIHNAGTAVITASKPADEVYAQASKSYNLVINPKAITLTVVTQPPAGRTLIPFHSESETAYDNSTTFMVSASGLVGIDTVSINLTGSNNYGLSVSNNTGIGSSNKTVTLNYNGTGTVPQTDSVNVVLVSGSGNYTFNGTPNIGVAIIDGQAEDRAIPVTPNNYAQFNVYANTTNGLKLHYKLTDNITFPPAAYQRNWTPIGTNITPFTGSFDGNSKTITGIYSWNRDTDYWGLFGYIGSNAVVKDLGIVNCAIVEGSYVGAVAGYVNTGARVERCYVKIEKDGPYYKGSVRGDSMTSTYNAYTGGLVGYNKGTVERCYFDGEVGGDEYTGGIVGLNEGTIQDCYSAGASSNNGSYSGGIAGQNKGTVQRCYSLISVAVGNINYPTGNFAGGIVGQNNSGASVQYCVALNSGISIYGNPAPLRIGRVAGENSGSLAGNQGGGSLPMSCNGKPILYDTGGTDPQLYPEEATSSGIHGSYAMELVGGGWHNMTTWDFEDIWEIRSYPEYNATPLLFGLDGQPPQL